jgi:hypothetical protein
MTRKWNEVAYVAHRWTYSDQANPESFGSVYQKADCWYAAEIYNTQGRITLNDYISLKDAKNAVEQYYGVET